ncbi:hydroxyacid dehydrogenase [Burkholderia ubonensis]|nr:hydroxyacid dehydrogenase [Burkholderia ubonensis]KWI31616.1 hydroxyacid dehydrogenase [Burkholderia ubonensis]OJB19152.1 hydroxyacid dehydrogenase [Burkholderia ubonensis]
MSSEGQCSGTDTMARTRRASVLICDPIPAAAVERMRAGGLRVDEEDSLSPEALQTRIGEYDAVVIRSATRLGEQQIAAARRLRVIVRAGVCADNVDLAAAASRRIAVLNTPKASTASVAELALGLLFALARRIPQADTALKSGRWQKKEFSDGIELAGKTLGIIGVGRIGGTLGRYAAALGMVVVGNDSDPSPSGCFDGLELLPLGELFARADFISIHIPPVPETGAQIGAAEIARMKDGVLLINCARGGVLDEHALLDALESGKVRGAALDVYAEEPPSDLTLVRHPGVVCTPHLGASTREAQARIGMEIAELLLDRL